ncbi:MAG: hypothetical protein ACI4TH_00120, partial [Candidatus Ornithomonoglobus sp.]
MVGKVIHIERSAILFMRNGSYLLTTQNRGNAGLWKKLCKQYLTKLDKAKITGISLIKSVNNNYWLLP